jgi:hypothetical protein
MTSGLVGLVAASIGTQYGFGNMNHRDDDQRQDRYSNAHERNYAPELRSTNSPGRSLAIELTRRKGARIVRRTPRGSAFRTTETRHS